MCLRRTADDLTAFRKELNEGGFVKGQNVAIEYRWAEGQYFEVFVSAESKWLNSTTGSLNSRAGCEYQPYLSKKLQCTPDKNCA
jgi:hypothetical protein